MGTIVSYEDVLKSGGLPEPSRVRDYQLPDTNLATSDDACFHPLEMSIAVHNKQRFKDKVLKKDVEKMEGEELFLSILNGNPARVRLAVQKTDVTHACMLPFYEKRDPTPRWSFLAPVNYLIGSEERGHRVGDFALRLACFLGHSAIVQILTENQKELLKGNGICLYFSLLNGHKRLAMQLLESGIDPFENYNETKHEIVKTNDLVLFRCFLRPEMNLNDLLVDAAKYDATELVPFLIENGAKADIPTPRGQYAAIQKAVMFSSPHILASLIDTIPKNQRHELGSLLIGCDHLWNLYRENNKEKLAVLNEKLHLSRRRHEMRKYMKRYKASKEVFEDFLAVFDE